MLDFHTCAKQAAMTLQRRKHRCNLLSALQTRIVLVVSQNSDSFLYNFFLSPKVEGNYDFYFFLHKPCPLPYYFLIQKDEWIPTGKTENITFLYADVFIQSN